MRKKQTDSRPIKDTSNNVNNENNASKRAGNFVPPTFEEVRSYCQERGNNVNPKRFIDFYSSKGWMVGKNKMKDWKASVRTWVNYFKLANSRCGCWRRSEILSTVLTNKTIAKPGYTSMLDHYLVVYEN